MKLHKKSVITTLIRHHDTMVQAVT